MSTKTAIAALFGSLLVPCTAWCFTGEYTTYCGFNSAVETFTKIAFVFNNATLNLIADAILACFVLLSILKGIFSILFNRRVGILSWVAPIIICIVVHLGFLVSKGTLTVYDQATHEKASIADVPEGIVVAASAFSIVMADFMACDAGKKISPGSVK